MTNNERRKSFRNQYDNRWIEVSTLTGHSPTNNAPTIKVKVENISETGVCLVSSSPFEMDQVIIFSENDMPNQGTVVWTCQSKVECKAGVHFT